MKTRAYNKGFEDAIASMGNNRSSLKVTDFHLDSDVMAQRLSEQSEDQIGFDLQLLESAIDSLKESNKHIVNAYMALTSDASEMAKEWRGWTFNNMLTWRVNELGRQEESNDRMIVLLEAAYQKLKELTSGK